MDERGANPNKKTHGGGLLYFLLLVSFCNYLVQPETVSLADLYASDRVAQPATENRKATRAITLAIDFKGNDSNLVMRL